MKMKIICKHDDDWESHLQAKKIVLVNVLYLKTSKNNSKSANTKQNVMQKKKKKKAANV